MKFLVRSIATFVAIAVFSVQVFAGHLSSAVGVYEMTWGNGKVGTYEIKTISDTAAEVVYSYGDKSQSKTLKVKKSKIVGGGWFPNVTFKKNGKVSVSHSGSSAKVEKK